MKKSPEWAPSDITLAEIFMWGGLFNEEVHLFLHIHRFFRREITSRQFGSDVFNDTDRFFVQIFRLWVISPCCLPHIYNRLFVARVSEFSILKVISMFLASGIAWFRTLCLSLSLSSGWKQGTSTWAPRLYRSIKHEHPDYIEVSNISTQII